MRKMPLKLTGFTLIEMMLVLVIMSTIVVMISNYTVLKTGQVRRDRAALQMQQILNAGLAYYINNSMWPGWVTASSSCPTALATLQGANYLPSNMKSPYINNQTYTITCDPNSGVFYVAVTTENQADANILAGMVPLGSTSGLTVTAQVNIPGQNLNNARSVNFVGVYRNGGCVPVPTCPGSAPQAMVAEIFVAATQVVGTYGLNPSGSTPTVYPITNFTAYPVGPAPIASVPNCFDAGTTSCAPYVTGTPTTNYWRVCLDVGTQAGDANNYSGATGANSWGQWQSIMAVTRCSPANESPGSTTKVWLP